MWALVLTAPLFHLMKVARLDFDFSRYIFYIGLPTVVAMLGFGALWQRTPPQRPLYAHLLLVAIFSVFVIFVTAVHGGILEDIAGNGVRIAFVAVALIALGGWGDEYRAILIARLPLLALIALIVSFGSVLLMYAASFTGLAVYFGLQVTPALLSLAYGLVTSRHIYTALSIIAIFGAGKRGGMMAAATLIMGYLAVAAGRVRIHRLLTFAAASLFILIFAFIFGLVPEAIVGRLDFLLELDEVDLNAATSGRIYELQAAAAILRDDPMVWIVGQGLGSTIDAYNTSFSTVHFTPVAMLLIFGLPMTVLAYGSLIAFVLFAFAHIRSGRGSGEDAIFFLVLLGELAFTLTAFTLLQSYLLWMAFIFLAVGMDRRGAAGRVSYHFRPALTR